MLDNDTADRAETGALQVLGQSVLCQMPKRSGGVLVVSVFGVNGQARSDRSACISGAYQTMKQAVDSYYAQGSVSAPDTSDRLWWALEDRADVVPDKGPSVLKSWP